LTRSKLNNLYFIVGVKMVFIRFIVLAFLAAFCWSMAFDPLPGREMNMIGVIISLSTIFFVPALYMQPTFEAWINKHPNLYSVALLNIFLGWTIVGWVGAIVWAFNKPSTVVVVTDHGTAGVSTSSTKDCPYCAEKIQIAAIKCKHCGSMLNELVEEKIGI
jgi:hypothetical protein